MTRMLRLCSLLSAVTACLATQIPLQASGSSSPLNSLLSPDFDAFIEQIRSNGSIPGVSMGVVRLGEGKEPVVQLASWGRKTEEGSGDDLTADTLFCLASCSKAFLATSLGILMEDFAEGRNRTPLPRGLARFDWDTKVSEVMPEEMGWALRELDGDGDGWATRKASVRDVLGHVSGLPRHDYAYAVGDTVESVVRRMGSLRTAYELREKWSYNNQMYVLGSYLVSHYATVPYIEFAASRIFEPLRMSATTFWPSVARRSGNLTDTWTKNGRRIPFWFSDDMVLLEAGVGGVISSAEDTVKWLATWLNKGVDPVSGERVFSGSVYDAVTTAHQVVLGSPSPFYGASIVGYGMGWIRWAHGDVEVVHHTGGIPGFSTMMAFSPSSNIGVAILSNADEKGPQLLEILKHTLDVVLGVQPSSGGAILGPVKTANPPPHEDDSSVSPPPLEIGAYTGIYTADGYRPIALCSAHNTSRYCDDVLSDFATLDSPVTLNSSLYSAYESLLATHVRLHHYSGDVFNISFTALFPKGYGRDTSAFTVEETGTSGGWVEFAVDDGRVEGFSLVVDEDAFAARKRRTGGEVRDAADAWFAKV